MAQSWAPTSDDVALHVPWRAQDPGATFTTTSVPTATQVQTLIDKVVVDVLADVGTVPTTPTDLSPLANLCAAVGTAYWVELGWTDEDANDGQSKAAALKKAYDEELARLRKAIVDGIGGDSALPYFGFPPVKTTWSTDF